MKTKLFLILSLFPAISSFAFTDTEVVNPYTSYFEEAFKQFPSVPRGVLEAVAFNNSHFNQITHEPGEEGSCVGIPQAYGVMGLIPDGKNYFNNNLVTVSDLSGYSTQEIISDPEKNILAYAKAYSILSGEISIENKSTDKINSVARILISLSELPHQTAGQQFALNTQLYGFFVFMNNPKYQALYHFPDPGFDLEKYFGDNYKILSSSSIAISDNEIKNKNGDTYRIGSNDPGIQSADYGPAIWNPAASCNYTVGRTQAISAVTIHDVEGTYAGCISWFQNCSAVVSAHYVVRSSDGQITQMVAEANKAWHVGSENPYTIGIEHEGYASQTGWYTAAMYAASAALCADICASGYGIDPLRTGWWPWLSTTYYNVSGIPGSCTKIKGHQHFPNQTHNDPGPNWDWDYFYMLINPPPAATNYTTTSGTIYDSGGAGGNYTDDERNIWTISPTAATSVTLTFNSFNTENTWDYLYIYDGNSVNAPLIGYYTGTNSPGTIVSSGGSLTLEFRSDCATTAAGWDATWTSNATSTVPANLSVTSLSCPNIGVVLNWTNSGAGWYVDVSTDPNFTTFYNKAVSNLTSVACPGGFCDYPGCTTYLKFQPNTTYYWRIFDGTTETVGPSFTTPYCEYSDFNCSGTFDDTGGPTNPYTGNENYVYKIMPMSASSVTMNFSSFDLEANFDSLFIYDGPNTTSPLIGAYTGTNSPGTFTSTDSAITLRFISDPFVNNAGFAATWNCTQLTTGITENTNSFSLNAFPNPFSDELHVNYSIAGKSDVKLFLVDVLGREVLLSSENNQTAGRHEQEINLNEFNVAKGIYFLRLNVNGESSTVKVVRD
ncbi:MAG TPA: CUB domain-containing protein [Bacteroidia bacterium]|nr:CUB domain-containing protein [Bacteroidia bacterium]